jgi:hypothetical protein
MNYHTLVLLTLQGVSTIISSIVQLKDYFEVVIMSIDGMHGKASLPQASATITVLSEL